MLKKRKSKMKHIKILEQFITEAKKFKAGDKWSKDFDYEGMLAAGLKVDVNTPVKKLNKLYDSFTDVNYHTIAKGLGIAIDWIEDNDKKGAEDYMDQFHKAVQDELKVNEGINLKASHLSSEDYQKAKKLKAFDSTDWVWNPKSNLYDKVSESVTEASRGKVHKAVKKGSYPVTLVVISNGMVVKQKLVDTPEAVPAHFNTLQKEYPNANISVEDNTGKRLFSESVNEADSDWPLENKKWEKLWNDSQTAPNTNTERKHMRWIVTNAKKYGLDPDRVDKLIGDWDGWAWKRHNGGFEDWMDGKLSESVNEGLSSSDIRKATETIKKYVKKLGSKANGTSDQVASTISKILGWSGSKIDQLDDYLRKINGGSKEIIFESVNEAKDNLYLQLHKKYADQIKGLKAKKIKKLTDLVSVQRWAMEDVHDTPGHDHKAMSAVFNNERNLFKQYMAGDHSVMLPESVTKSNIPNFGNFNINEAKIIKDYMSAISIKDFKNIKKGDEVKYMGGTYTITRNNGYTITLQGSEKRDKAFDVNYRMFNHGGMIIEGKSYQEKFKEESDYYQEMINDPSKRVYDIVDFAQFTTGGMTQKQWEMFMYGRYKKDLQSKDSKIKEKMYKVLNKWLGESITESSSKDGGDKSNGKSHHGDHTNKSIAQHWKDTYGEEFHSKYPAIAKIVKSRPGIDRRELKRIWDETYGENFEEQYPALWQKLD
jgi:hypothetical protein